MSVAAAFILVGAVLVVAGTAWFSPAAALIVAGVLALLAGIDLRPRGEA